MSPITSEQFDKGKTVEKIALGEVMDADSAYTVPEMTELLGKSWGICKKQLLAAEEEGYALQRKIGRSIYWRYYPEGVPEELRAEVEEDEDEE